MGLGRGDGEGFWARAWGNISLLDVSAIAYLGYYVIRLALTPNQASRDAALLVFGVALLVFLFILGLTRGDIIRDARVCGLVYRLGLFLTLLCTYIFGFKSALMGLDLTLLDGQLTQIDHSLFGCIPAVYLSQAPHPMAVEWFSFFYYLHFAVVALALIPVAVMGHDSAHLSRLMGGFFLIVIGWITYSFVPGLGPYQTMTFSEPLVGGFWFGLTMETVQAAGPQIDVFPSLHTAFTLFVGLHCIHFRKRQAMGWAAFICLFMAANIIFATLYLRFHYAVDVLAGIVLAIAVALWSPTYFEKVSTRRASQLYQPLFGYPLRSEGRSHE